MANQIKDDGIYVFDQDHVVESGAVIGGAPGGHGGFFQQAKPGGRLPGVENHGARAADRLDVSARHGGNAGEPLEEIQCGPLRGENRCGTAADPENRISGLETRPVGLKNRDAKRAVHS